ncbi:DNA polymerase Y family protein [Microbacterium sp. X-17]|uniref:DNA polymerase Y family protein n=1 Tax=Microbacterium sp. X-17 TaxID=3144404 RepID=UPI0031F5193B
MSRVLVLWVPEWPVVASLRESAGEAEGPVAVVEAGAVVACSAAARAEGVRRGQRRRDAQARCPSLVLAPADPLRDQREFAPLVARIEQVAPGVQIVRPGLCALRARGPVRYYGGEAAAARALLEALAELGVGEARAAVADGLFTAELAVRTARADDPVRLVPEGEAAAFLAPLPVTTLDDAATSHRGEELATLLARLGVQTLGEFAALDPARVEERLGDRGRRLHALAAGEDSRAVEPRVPPPQLHREVAFEPPVELADQIAFGMRIAAEEFIARLGALGLVCTELRVELTGERGERCERVWLHPGSFDAAAVVDRVRWQLAEQAVPERPKQEPGAEGGAAFRSGVAHVRIAPEAVDRASHHAAALFGGGPDERVHHALSRVQAMLGHRGVMTAAIGGGRRLAERQVLVPWGDRAVVGQDRARPWPGGLPAPLPATVFPRPEPVVVRGDGESPVSVDERGILSAIPRTAVLGGRRHELVAWAGPWPLVEREWDAVRRRVAHRFQVVDDDQNAWLLVCEGGAWYAEARYD